LEGKIIALLGVLLEEESDLTVALLLEVADDRAAAQLSAAQDLSDFCEVLLLKGALE